VTIRRVSRRVSPKRLAGVVARLLDASTLCALSTVSPRGNAHVNAMYFAWDDAFQLVWISDPNAAHSRHLERNASAAVMVYDSRQTWGGRDRGLQLFGSAKRVEGRAAREAEAVYADRFPAYSRDEQGSYDFYVLRPSRLKAFDEDALGSGLFVTARMRTGGRLEWERTEVYSGT
jgi:uncharacterized protein YhbP (UPF0306 family)